LWTVDCAALPWEISEPFAAEISFDWLDTAEYTPDLCPLQRRPLWTPHFSSVEIKSGHVA
jgi:hypothetical protein